MPAQQIYRYAMGSPFVPINCYQILVGAHARWAWAGPGLGLGIPDGLTLCRLLKSDQVFRKSREKFSGKVGKNGDGSRGT